MPERRWPSGSAGPGRRCATAGARFELPDAAELPARVAAVLDVLYLVFNEGYTRSSGDTLVDGVADRRGDPPHPPAAAARCPDHDEVAGALALMLLTQRAGGRADRRRAATSSRWPSRTARRWDAGLIAEGVAILERVLPRGPVGRFQLQAAIAAVHAEAPTYEDTDWLQIARALRDARAGARRARRSRSTGPSPSG